MIMKQDKPFTEFCVWTAVKISQLPEVECQECFDFLLTEALKQTTSNNFVTTLLICIGFIKVRLLNI